jgi:hypothetical protein
MPEEINPKIDLTNVSEKDLQLIHNEVLKALTERAIKPGGLVEAYDRHGSGHSKSTGKLEGIIEKIIRR